MGILKLTIHFTFLLVFATGAMAAEVVYFPIEKDRKFENEFEYKILKAALMKSGKYVLKPAKSNMNEARSKAALSEGKGLSVAWYGTNADIEKKLKPVRIPITAGLTGYRLFLINKSKQPEFSKVKTLDDLKKFVSSQGRGWSDIAILKNAGLQVKAKEYKNIFKLVNAGRIDYFPRGAAEVFHEMSVFGGDNPNLAAEQNVMMYYRFAKLFFVNKDNQKLHDAIYKGLEALHADGTYWKMFNEEPAIKKTLAQANFAKRVRIDIPNPFMSKETNNIPSKFWYKPK